MLSQTERVAAFLQDDPALARSAGAHGIPVLFHAALGGKTEIGELVLAHGSGDGIDEALHGAVIAGRVEMVAWLLTHGAGANVDVLDVEGKTPLRVAVERGHDHVAAVLRRHGASA